MIGPYLQKKVDMLSEEDKCILFFKLFLPQDLNNRYFELLFNDFILKHFKKFDASSDSLKVHDSLQNLIKQSILDKKFTIFPKLLHSLACYIVSDPQSQSYKNVLLSLVKARKLPHIYLFGETDLLITLRLALYTHDEDAFAQAYYKLSNYKTDHFFNSHFYSEKIDVSWLKTIPVLGQEAILRVKFDAFLNQADSYEVFQPLLEFYNTLRTQRRLESHYIFYLYHFLMWDEHYFDNDTFSAAEDSFFKTFKATLFFIKGDTEKALKLFEEALKLYRKQTDQRTVFFPHTHQLVFYVIAMLASDHRKHRARIKRLLDENLEGKDSFLFIAISHFSLRLEGEDIPFPLYKMSLQKKEIDPLIQALTALVLVWLRETKDRLEMYQEGFDAYKNTLPLVAKIYADCLKVLASPGDRNEDIDTESYLADDRFKGMISFATCVPIAEKWELALDNLHHFLDKTVGNTEASKRLIWLINPASKHISVFEQVFQKNGLWSAGRPMPLKRLYDQDPRLTYLTKEDKKVIKTLRFDRMYRWNLSTGYDWDSIQTPLALVGHPCVYEENKTDKPIELVKTSPQLLIKKQEAACHHVGLSHQAQRETVIIEKESPSCYNVIHFSPPLVELSALLGQNGLTIPIHAQDKLERLIYKASPLLPIYSEFEAADISSQPGDTTPHLQMMPLGDDGLSIHLNVRPFGNQGPYGKPGQGSTSLLIVEKGQTLKAIRDLAEETTKAKAILKACPYLGNFSEKKYEWEVDGLENCLEVLDEIKNLDQDVIVSWPKGQSLSLDKQVSFKNLSLQIQEKDKWLMLQGDFHLDEETVLSLQNVLASLNNASGRFIPLGDKRFLSLTQNLKDKLHMLKEWAHETKEGQAFPLIGAATLRSLAEQAGQVNGDQNWKKTLAAFKNVDKETPLLDPSFKAELRDYQLEGFEWLSRLAALKLGACLADDMGLGKTVQTIALMMNMASQGPCLVIAPTSVCYNWINEINRFAPTLTCHTLSDKHEDLAASLQEKDVLVCSYRLLHQNSDILEKITWSMIVLDEAQAIKNSTTKAFQAAIKLNGAFRLALSGTPIENSLEDLWSLFRFIVPGLLGTQESFQKKFSASLHKERPTKQGLKPLIQPFILRRTKNKVLTELPPRIEKTFWIDPSQDEIHFYEALRRQAIENISGLEATKGSRKIHILAEITKLRRACCHPSLVHPDTSLSSSKMDVFLNLVDDLLKNNHQALIFSQYVSYLTLVRQALEARGYGYQYLDGSTSADLRKKQVQDFQDGKNPLFLLSLKAGGMGLNLTTADYVIHLDPWWNPAVEDQASDRAHRLGQTRSVTIYRLIMKNTIEEKIIELHKNKRELATDLLEGTHQSTKLSEDDLMRLMMP